MPKPYPISNVKSMTFKKLLAFKHSFKKMKRDIKAFGKASAIENSRQFSIFRIDYYDYSRAIDAAIVMKHRRNQRQDMLMF